MDSVTKVAPETFVYTSETIYGIDCEKHFDVNIGSAAAIMLSSGNDEKVHVRMSSETLENLSSMYKIKLYSKRHNKFLLPVLAKAIYGSFCKTESEISNVVNYKKNKM